MQNSTYILSAEPFAQPILMHLQDLVLRICPEAEIKIKWNFPCFLYKGKILCNMAAFKQHCSFGFWLASKMDDPHGYLQPHSDKKGMGNLGRITSVKSIPEDDVLAGFIFQGMELIDQGVTLDRSVHTEKESHLPEELKSALDASRSANRTFLAFSESHKREYIQWINEAKTERTREKRIAQTIEWLEEGKVRNWKYSRK